MAFAAIAILFYLLTALDNASTWGAGIAQQSDAEDEAWAPVQARLQRD